jgi:hypothetical protein
VLKIDRANDRAACDYVMPVFVLSFFASFVSFVVSPFFVFKEMNHERHENGRRNDLQQVIGWQSRDEQSHGWNTDQTPILRAGESTWSDGIGPMDGRAVPRIRYGADSCFYPWDCLAIRGIYLVWSWTKAVLIIRNWQKSERWLKGNASQYTTRAALRVAVKRLNRRRVRCQCKNAAWFSG